MNIEGRLHIRMKQAKGAVDAVSIESNRPVYASRVFHGKGIAESLQMIPLLFSICATAQACAGVRACEQALGVQATTQTERLRDMLVNMETLREHLWRILLEWPSFTGGEPDGPGMAAMVAIEREYRQALCPDGNPFLPGGAVCRTDTEALKGVVERFAVLLQQRVFAMPPGEWLALAGREEFAGWMAARQTVATELTDQVCQAGWSDAGACDSEVLPRLTGAELNQAMQDIHYVKQPQWSGRCRETSSLTRVDSPLLKALSQAYANGLLVRQVARLTEIARLAGQMLPDAAEGAEGHRVAELRPENPGIGQAAAARGQLVHRVELNGDVIGSYQILAPTEWNFHPKGVVVQALSTLKGDSVRLERQARLLIDAIDPCVGYELSLVEV